MARKTRNEAEWRSLVAQWEQSGEKVSEFCRSRKVTASRFWAWRKRISQEPKSRRSNPPAFFLAEIQGNESGADPGAWLEVCLGGNRRLRILGSFDAAALRAVVEALEKC
jgi:hypothetical protein